MEHGTFKITPSLWCQTFVISVQVQDSVFAPVAFCLLPDKKRGSYDAMFSMLKEALELRGLSLSGQWFMADFEVVIRDSSSSHFEEVEVKGCGFHFCKAIISISSF